MNAAPEVLLVAAVAAVGVFHTVVPDHWLPIALIAREQRWSTATTARAAALAGTGHTLSTLAIGLLMWVAGIAFATRFGSAVSTVSSLALVAFGGWIAIAALRELRGAGDEHHGALDAGASEAPGPGGERGRPRSMRTTLLLILGSSPMVEGLPAFFAAARFGPRLIAVMSVVFAFSTIATYVGLCIVSTAGLRRVKLGAFERYGEVISGTFIVLVGAIFLVFPQA